MLVLPAPSDRSSCNRLTYLKSWLCGATIKGTGQGGLNHASATRVWQALEAHITTLNILPNIHATCVRLIYAASDRQLTYLPSCDAAARWQICRLRAGCMICQHIMLYIL
jgi:hypothetical protein